MLIPRTVRHEALHAAEQAVGAVLARYGIHRDLFGRFELLDLALDEAEAGPPRLLRAWVRNAPVAPPQKRWRAGTAVAATRQSYRHGCE